MIPRSFTCRDWIDRLTAYLDAELSAAEHAAFEAHLGVCPDCVDYLASYREAIRLGRLAFGADAEPAAEVPEELIEAILAARNRR